MSSPVEPSVVSPPASHLTPEEQKRYRVIFWGIFLGTPVATFLQLSLSGSMSSWLPSPIRFLVEPGISTFFLLACGAYGAGYSLMRLRNPTEHVPSRLFGALGYAVLLGFAYLGIAFVGCLVVGMSGAFRIH